jgi:hypothetical protein
MRMFACTHLLLELVSAEHGRSQQLVLLGLGLLDAALRRQLLLFRDLALDRLQPEDLGVLELGREKKGDDVVTLFLPFYQGDQIGRIG